MGIQAKDLGQFPETVNSLIAAIIGASNINYYALGSSKTVGVGSTGNNISYADIINSKLKFKSFHKIAVSGATVMTTAGRSKLSEQVALIGAEANLITVLMGFNDFDLDNVVGDVSAVIDKPYASLDESLSFSEAFRYNMETIKKNHPNAKIIALTMTQFSSAHTGLYNAKDYMNAQIAICNYLSIPIVDFYNNSGIWIGDSEYTVDGVHPNDIGYNMMADYLIYKLLLGGSGDSISLNLDNILNIGNTSAKGITLNNDMIVQKDGGLIGLMASNKQVRVWLGHISNYGGYINLIDDDNVVKARLRSYASSGVQGYFLAGNIGFMTDTPSEAIDVNGNVKANGFKTGAETGATGSFTTNDGKTVTVTNGIITDIV